MRSRLVFALLAVALTLIIGLAAWMMGNSRSTGSSEGNQIAGAAPTVPTFAQLPADMQVLIAGRSLYVTNCLSCHGADGRGDAAYAAESDIKLPDLVAQMASGVRSDEQLTTWIKTGISGTSQPGFGLVLRDDEIRQLVAYLRALGQPGQIALPPLDLPTAQPTPIPVPDVAEPLPPLAFAREGKLWRSKGDGAAPQIIAQIEGLSFISDLAISHDGGRIAFVSLDLPEGSERDVAWTLYVVGSDGKGLRAIGKPSAEQLSSPAWSHDGTALFVGRSGTQTTADGQGTLPRFELLRVDLASGTVQVVQADATSPAVSPDGASLAFSRIDPQTYAASLQIAPLGGGSARTIIDGVTFGTISALHFSPDGSQIVFAASGGPTGDQETRRPGDQGPLAGLIAELGNLLGPSVALAHGDPQDLWLVGSDGQGLRRLTTLYEDEPHAAFSPDGREIIAIGANGIYRMSADGSNLRRIDPRGDHGGLVWLK